MSTMASQITSVSIVYLIVCSNAGQRKHRRACNAENVPFADVIMTSVPTIIIFGTVFEPVISRNVKLMVAKKRSCMTDVIRYSDIFGIPMAWPFDTSTMVSRHRDCLRLKICKTNDSPSFIVFYVCIATGHSTRSCAHLSFWVSSFQIVRRNTCLWSVWCTPTWTICHLRLKQKIHKRYRIQSAVYITFKSLRHTHYEMPSWYLHT